MNLAKLEQEVPFDQFSRQYQVTTILNKLRLKDETLRVLDVGGHKGRTADFLTADTVTVMDLYELKSPNYVQGSALDMPFEDDSFDYVLSFDVLEHIPSEQRDKFFDECARVAQKGVIICAPHRTEANEFAEQNLNNLYRHLHNTPHEWLKEHIEYGIPDFKKIKTYATTKGWTSVVFHSNKTELWLLMQEAIFINSKFPLASEQLVAVNKFYNQNFKYDGGGLHEAAYRLIIFFARDAELANKLAKDLGPLNNPINTKLELQLFEKIANYKLQLVEKTATLATDYKNLYEHEKKRACELQDNGEALSAKLRAFQRRSPLYIVKKKFTRKKL